MEFSASFSLDARAFSPYAITDTDVTVSLSDNKVQQLATYDFSFTSPVPLEVDTAGCFIRFIFPDDFIITSGDFATFEGYFQMQPSSSTRT